MQKLCNLSAQLIYLCISNFIHTFCGYETVHSEDNTDGGIHLLLCSGRGDMRLDIPPVLNHDKVFKNCLLGLFGAPFEAPKTAESVYDILP